MSMREICLAGGCFWGTEAYLKLLPGVVETSVGYANSSISDPSYEEVCTGVTNAAEAVLLAYDDEIISLDLLLEAFFGSIDPTSLNRQGNDRGTQYRTGIYWIDEADETPVRSFLNRKQRASAQPIVVEPSPLLNFYPAEDYHQDYLGKHPHGYCHVDLRDARRFAAEHFPDTTITD